MRLVWGTLVLVSALAINWSAGNVNAAGDLANAPITGFREPAKQREIEARFLAAPDAKLAEEHLRILTQAPHIAGSPEDKATAEYVAQQLGMPLLPLTPENAEELLQRVASGGAQLFILSPTSQQVAQAASAAGTASNEAPAPEPAVVASESLDQQEQ